jgi:hypothetical protein
MPLCVPESTHCFYDVNSLYAEERYNVHLFTCKTKYVFGEVLTINHKQITFGNDKAHSRRNCSITMKWEILWLSQFIIVTG